MKSFPILFGLLCSTSALCQVQVTGIVLDKETGKPIPELYFEIHKDYDTYIDIDKTNGQGKFTGTIRAEEFNSKSKYQIFIDNNNYEKTAAEIDITSNKPITIELHPRVGGPRQYGCSDRSLGYYVPYALTGTSELPDSIQRKLTKHLVDRLGNKFYSRTKFTGGQVVNFHRLHIVEPNSLNYKTPVNKYYLCFAIDTISTSIAMDSTGKVTQELSFPAISQDAAKAKIISERQAIKIAKQNKAYHKKTTTVFFGYDQKNDCFEWEFKNCTYKGINVSCSILHLAAHTGQVLRISRSGGKRSFF
jgi:5-hydroxyisourate hydrolase-like protein (transthyretin family)